MVLVVDIQYTVLVYSSVQHVQLTGLIESMLVNDWLEHWKGKREFYTHYANVGKTDSPSTVTLKTLILTNTLIKS